MIKEFKEFIAKGNVVDLAVAVILGAAFGLIVTAFTKGILMPLIGIVGGQASFDDYKITINGSDILWGSFVTATVNFLIVAFALFLIVKAMNRMQNLRKKEEVEEDEITELQLLTEIRDLLVAQSSQAS
jgi:large conductance mechanosensitive channel